MTRLYEVTVLDAKGAFVTHQHYEAAESDDACSMAIDAYEGPTKATIEPASDALTDAGIALHPNMRPLDDYALGVTKKFTYLARPAVVVRVVATGQPKFVAKDSVYLNGESLCIDRDGKTIEVIMQVDDAGKSTEQFVVLDGGKRDELLNEVDARIDARKEDR